MGNNLITFDYDREKAVEYAHRWAFERNPEFFDFTGLGGNCTNFVSQCIYAGSGVMNYTPTYGWYYRSVANRSPSWTGVIFLYNFLTANTGTGPFGSEVSMSMIEPGDVIQLMTTRDVFQHSLLVVETGPIPSPQNILVNANTVDSQNRALASYNYRDIRFIHIEGVRSYPA